MSICPPCAAHADTDQRNLNIDPEGFTSAGHPASECRDHRPDREHGQLDGCGCAHQPVGRAT